MSTRISKHPTLSRFARRLMFEWRQLKLPLVNEPVVLAVSGGADSTALVLAVDELLKTGKIAVEVFVAHLDHGLRNSSRQDAIWVKNLAKDLSFTPVVGRFSVRSRAETSRSKNIEQLARDARYEFLERTAKRNRAQFVLTGHTMDDQAETVLLRLMRGSAGAGLSAMEKVRPISTGSGTLLARPILWALRSETEDYCNLRRKTFLKDEMNEDESFARVRVRKQLVPLMKTFNNKIVEALARTADLLREDAFVIGEKGEALLREATIQHEPRSGGVPTLSVSILARAPLSVRRAAILTWLSQARGDKRGLEMVHIFAIDRLLVGKTGGRTVELPRGGKVSKRQGRLEFRSEND